jgi:membrane peptidoglycan carboxypeptidase
MRRRRPQRPWWRSRRLAWVGGALIGLLVLSTLYVVWTLRDMPDPGQDNVLAGSVVILDRKGREVEQRNAAGQYHIQLKLSEMGPYGPSATLAAEDRDFYHHGPLDFGATGRAAWNDLTSRGYNQGGSTITQQLVKIQLLTPQKSVFRKVQEATLAVGVERRYSKQQILEMYLNRVYYGHGAYGIGAAARTYFGRDAKDLTPAQASLLAGLIQAPNYYDPKVHLERAKARQLYVLKGMVTTRALTQAEADKAAAEDVKGQLKFDQEFRKSKAPAFVDYVISKLEGTYGASAVQQGGFAVQTTLDLDIQQIATNAVANGVADLRYGRVNNADLLAARPDTGEILAWVGSADYYNNDIGGQFDVILSPRQPGSSFKPYVYEAALKDRKLTLGSILHDKPSDFQGYKPLDFDNSYRGDMTVREALVQSRNIPAVEAADMEGIQRVISLAHQMGIRSELQPFLSTAIGGSEVTMFEHVQGYQTFANQGTRVPLMAISQIKDTQGNLLYGVQPGQQDGKQQVLTPAEAFLITDALKDYPTTWGFGWNRRMAAKTGTTGSVAGQMPDSWVMAYNPNIVVGTWVGNTGADGKGSSINVFGESVGKTLLARFINALPPNMGDWYRRPDGLADGKGCKGPQELLLAGTQPTCPSPSPSPSPTPSPSLSPSPSPSQATRSR